MPSSVESGDELVFLSPEEGPTPEKQGQSQGASPQLRRSSRKRKSVAGPDMSKGSGSKKKRNSTGNKKTPPKEMPRVTRSPAKEGPGTAGKSEQSQEQTQPRQTSLERLLAGMEARLASKIDATNSKVEKALELVAEASTALEDLELKIVDTEMNLERQLAETEDRLEKKMTTQVKTMVMDQLAAAGFDQDLSAGDLSVRKSALLQGSAGASSYAGVTALSSALEKSDKPGPSAGRTTREDQREARFWKARRSLRLWPVPGGNKEGLEDYLLNKLRLERSFIDEDLGLVELARPREPKNKNKDEIIVTFETKQVRDAVKAAAPNLANFRETAGMRLHIPDHLQRDFQTLMNLSYDLKKKHPNLKRNVKFDEEDGGLYMDLKKDETAEWKRVKPVQAAAANKGRSSSGVKSIGEDERKDMLGGE